MRIFSSLYDRVMQWSRHRHAPYYLAGLSFAESSFFPIPPDVMLAPMSMANPKQSWWFAGLTTVASVLGGPLAAYMFELTGSWSTVFYIVSGLDVSAALLALLVLRPLRLRAVAAA